MKNTENYTMTEEVVKNIEVSENNFMSIDLANHGGFGVKNKSGEVPPKPGDTLQIYWEHSTGWGGRVVGLSSNGKDYFYSTRAQLEKEHNDWLKNLEERKEKEYQEKIEQWIADKNTLIEPLRQRLDRFEQESGFEEFWKNDGWYELYVLVDAQKLYQWAMESPALAIERIEIWEEFDYDKQVKTINMGDGHSGFSFSCVVGLAKRLVKGESV